MSNKVQINCNPQNKRRVRDLKLIELRLKQLFTDGKKELAELLKIEKEYQNPHLSICIYKKAKLEDLKREAEYWFKTRKDIATELAQFTC